MNNKDVIKKLITYQQELNNRLSAAVPIKHMGHPQQYKSYLKNELRLVNDKLDALKTQ